MSTLSPQSEAVITQFARQPGVTQDQVANLRTVLNGSPALVDQFNSVVHSHDLRHIGPLTNPNAGGQYNPATRTMELPLSILTPPLTGEKIGEATFVLGHELRHAPDRHAVDQASQTFGTAVYQKAQQPGAQHDYTPELRTMLAANRQDEAKAEISGWNAVVGAVRVGNPNPTLEQIYNFKPSRMDDFIDRTGTSPNYSYALKPNLHLNADMSMSPTPGPHGNVEGMGQNYYDQTPAALAGAGRGLGHNGTSDYQNLYAASLVGYIVTAERTYHAPQPGVHAPVVAIDMQRLKLNESLLEQNGLDLGAIHTPMQYKDIGTHPASTHHFDHTVSGPHAHQYVPVVPAAGASRGNGRAEDGETREQGRESAAAPAQTSPLDALNPADQHLHQRMLEVARANGYDDERAGNIAAQGVLAFKRDGLVRQADDVGIYGGNLMTSYFPFGRDREPNYHTPPLDAASAAQVPAQQTLQQAAEVERQQAQQQTLAPQVQQADGPKGPSMGARAL